MGRVAEIRIRPVDNRAVSGVVVSNLERLLNRMEYFQRPLTVEGQKERKQE